MKLESTFRDGKGRQRQKQTERQSEAEVHIVQCDCQIMKGDWQLNLPDKGVLGEI